MNYLIESMEHTYGDKKAWWKPNCNGYTTNLEEAGRYSQEEAERICARANIVEKNECMWTEEQVYSGVAGKIVKSVEADDEPNER